ncbi:MAG: aromatic amino acid transport family protein [Chlamydiales bacterium]|nr:aromatic amino acid transport family protein [Chlamydiales bacterium]
MQVHSSSNPYKKIVSGSLLVAGTAIGAGMLGIPMVTGNAGFIPATLITILVWAFMLTTGLLLLEVTLKMKPGSNILSITEKYFGKSGKIFAGIMFVFLYYCLIVAYIAGGSPLIESLLTNFNIHAIPTSLYYIFFTVVIAIVVYTGVKWIDRINIVLSLAMFTAYILMFVSGAHAISNDRLLDTALFGEMFFAVPILFGAFGYHNVVPSLCDYLRRDKKSLQLSLIIGTTLALLIYLVWQYLVIGSIDAKALTHAMKSGQTTISALQEATNRPSLYLFGRWFGMLALLTSLLGVSLSMCDFFADGFRHISVHLNRFWLCCITFIPPLVFTLFNPAVFTKALGIAGGIGESILNGLLPVALIWVSKYILQNQTKAHSFHKLLLCFLFILGIAVIGIEIYNLS